ncbi:MAG: FkbM family methyltransferase [Actinobacteria bacterium]|nr:FkbM family methyltransferase [Actinomycetota bacterium]
MVQLNRDSKLRVYLDDPYWSRLIAKSYKHEPELHHVFRRLSGLAYTLIDCGANFGYWSILVSSEAYGSKKVLAVEASPSTYQDLLGNCKLNGDRFQCFHQAVTTVPGARAAVRSANGHPGASITFETDALDNLATVETVSLDALVQRQSAQLPSSAPLFVKLDVEGQEINAFKGAEHLLARDTAFCYEDHGKDVGAPVTRYILDELHLRVMYPYPDGSLLAIESVQEAARIQTRRTHGYNFLAFRPETSFAQFLS